MQKTCIIIPCYNEAGRLDLVEIGNFISSQASIDLLFVDDGSTDQTFQVLGQLKQSHSSRINILKLNENAGKAEAVRQGVLHTSENTIYHFAGYWDADLATPLSEVPYFIEQLGGGNKSLVLGSRIKRMGSVVERSNTRHYFGRVFSTLASIILKLPVYDSQCGAKVFRIEMALLFREKFLTRWLFDVELLARFRNTHGSSRALSEILEVPVNSWIEKGGSKLKLKHLLKVPLELIRIHRWYNK